jgi:hypothetical protein
VAGWAVAAVDPVERLDAQAAVLEQAAERATVLDPARAYAPAEAAREARAQATLYRASAPVVDRAPGAGASCGPGAVSEPVTTATEVADVGVDEDVWCWA